MKMTRTQFRKKLREQRLYGLGMLLISALAIVVAATGNSIEGRDCTAVFLILPLGLYLLFTRHIVKEEAMNRVTYKEFLSFDPCWLDDGRGDELKEIYDQYPNGMTALDILYRDDVSAKDKLRSVLRPEFIPEVILHEFACDQAEFALSLVDNPDPRSVAAIETKRRWMRGEATDAELAAACEAARSAAYYATYYAAYYPADCSALRTVGEKQI